MASYIHGYILLTITCVIGLNGFILFQTYFQKTKREELRRFFYPTDEQQGKKESGFVFFTAVLTSWISPCSIWANTFGRKTSFLLISSSTCIVVYFINIIAVGISEELGYIIPTENPPITRCFHEINKFDTSKYRLFFSQNSTLLDKFHVCNNYEECQPAIRICAENENPFDELCKVFIPVGIGLLAVSFFAALILQNLGHHYAFLKMLIQSWSIETNNFANAFNAFWKNKNLIDKIIQNELKQQMKNAVVNSDVKREAVNTIFNIFAQEAKTAASEKVLIKNLSLLTFTANESSVWNSPRMHKAVEDNNYTWFSFLIFLGGECGAKNGQMISSISMLRGKKVQNKNLLDNYNFITKRLITSALKEYQEFALHIAAAKGNHQEIERLIANSYDVDLKDNNNQTPLHIASKNGHFDIVKILVDNDADKESTDENEQTPLHLASRYGHFEIVKYLVKKGADKQAKDKHNKTPLHIAAEKGHFKIVKFLVENGAEKEAKEKDDWTPLHLAAWNGHLETVKFLAENGAEKEAKTKKGSTPLTLASGKGHLGIVQFLVVNGAEKEAKINLGHTSLHLAAERGHLEIVKFLVENGAEKEAKEKDDWTPLHISAQNNHLQTVKFLVENGAEKEAKQKDDYTPLHIAAQNGHLETVKFLVENGAEKEAKQKDDWTPLHIAAQNGPLEIVKFLVENGAEKEAKQKNEWTPLHLAAAYGHLETVIFLIESGSNYTVQTKNKETPFDTATRNGHKDIAKFIKDFK